MRNKRILLGISGGIAAYKIASLIRLLKKSGADVKVVMTPASCDFISPLVVSTLSGNPVNIEMWNKETGVWTNHVDLALWADVFLIAPLTANTLAKMAVGVCDNLLLASYFSSKCKTIIAPAMDLDMYAHPTTKANLEKLLANNVSIIPAENGELASGLFGEGRMAEPETIYAYIEKYIISQIADDTSIFCNKQVLITAGPTYEAIDPVRFIGNRSSGKMGFAIAEKMLEKGALVNLISGPTSIKLTHPNLKIYRIQSADEMYLEVKSLWPSAQIGVFAAAVADYKPKITSSEKIKKQNDSLLIELVRNPDSLAYAGKNKSLDQIIVGFALETNNEIENSKAKLISKNADIMVLNSLQDKGAGFESDTNKITILDANNNLSSFELKAKVEVAEDIVNYIEKYLK